MSCRWGRRGEGAFFVWGRHGGEQRAPGRCNGTGSRLGARYREAWLRGWLMPWLWACACCPAERPAPTDGRDVARGR